MTGFIPDGSDRPQHANHSGLAVVADVRAIDPHLPVLLMSRLCRQRTTKQYRRGWRNSPDFEPFTTSELDEKVRLLLS